MQVSSETLSGVAAALSLLEHSRLRAEEGRSGLQLDWTARAYGHAPFALVALDREGAAVTVGDSETVGQLDPDLLELLEADAFWSRFEVGRTYSANEIASALASWPSAELAMRCFRDQAGHPLGVLLLSADRAAAEDVVDVGADAVDVDAHAVDAGPDAVDADIAAAGDRLLVALLRQWRLAQDCGWLTEFSRALIAVQGCGVLATDGRGRVTYLNHDASELLAIPAEQAIGSDCARVLQPAAGSDHPLLAGLDGRIEHIELYVRDHHGQERPLSLRLRRMLDSAGETAGVVCLLRDPSPERTLDQETRRRDRLAVIGELAAGVAHEIRNPLTGIGNCAQLLQDRLAADSDNRRMADLILRETQRLDRIVTSLLTFARPGPPQMRASRIVDVVRAALELEEAHRAQAGVRTELRTAGRIPEIFIDPEQIQQVVVNLVRNATQAMPDGGVLTVEITVVRRPMHVRRGLGRRADDRVRVVRAGPVGRFVRLRVRDTGCGIPDEILPRLFDPFFTTRSGGTGLGLSVSQAIIHEHGGSIAVSSAAGAGAVFEVDLPVERRQGERRRED